MTEGADYNFLTVGDGGPATVAFPSGEIVAYSASTADAAILNQRGMPVRDITPPEFARFFGNGLATMGDTIRDDPELVEKFGRAFVRGHAFALDDANRETVLAHLAAGNPQEGEDPDFAVGAVRRGALQDHSGRHGERPWLPAAGGLGGVAGRAWSPAAIWRRRSTI